MKVKRINLITLLLVVFISGVYLGMYLKEPIIIDKTTIQKIQSEQYTQMRLPAITNNGSGVSTLLMVSVKPGTGKVLVNVNNILAKEDTQHSARMAAYVAGNYTNTDISNLDIIYDILANASILEGPSAGTAMAITTIAALENKTINQDVMITGTINHDGSIGPSSAVLSKAKAAKEAGANLFLVPVGESETIEYSQDEFCKVYGIYKYCTPEVKPKKVKISEEVGIEVIEVKTISEALGYFMEDLESFL